MLIGGGNRYLHLFILIDFELISSSRIEDEDCPLKSFKIRGKLNFRSLSYFIVAYIIFW